MEVNLTKQTKTRLEYEDTNFTFHPRVSTASSKMVENLGIDFHERQKRHVERQRTFLDENQSVLIEDQTPKRLKMYNGRRKFEFTKYRPKTSDRGLLKKRVKQAENRVRIQSSEVLETLDTNSMDASVSLLSPSPPILPPRSKTYCMSVSQSLDASGLYGVVASKKRSVADPYVNFDRLQRAKTIAEKAIKNKKIFSIHGSYPLIRKGLRERGWVEKEFKLPPKLKNTAKSFGDTSDVDDYDDDDGDNDDDSSPKDGGLETSPRNSLESSEVENDSDDYYGIMGRMVRNEIPTFQWTIRTTSIDWKFLQKDQIVNHFSKANFTTKVGLCMNLRMLACFADGHSDYFFPRCYRLSNEEDKLDFIDDFRLTAVTSILKILISRHIEDSTGSDDDKIKIGQLPPKTGAHIIPTDIITFAIKVCRLYGKERNHEDIDVDDSILQIPDENWNRLISYYYKLVHEGAVIPQSGAYFNECEEVLNILKDKNPQFFIEGCKNVWIVKPGAKSRGRGIIVMDQLDEMLKLVSGDSTLIKDGRWVVQKYIERPLLLYGTKFDVRQWFLVTDWNPVTVWIYKESYLRFSSRPFSLKHLDSCIHLCNYSVQKNFENDPNQHPDLPSDNIWSNGDFQNYLKSRGCHALWDNKIFPGMRKAIIHICQTAQDTVENRRGSFELYGADFMIDEGFNPWLIEVNSSPTMARSTTVTKKLCASVQEDTLKVILDRKKDKNCDIGEFELMFKQPMVDVPLYVGKTLNVEGIAIKKPTLNVRKSFNSLPFSNVSYTTCRGETNEILTKSLQKVSTVYGQSNVNKSTRVHSNLPSRGQRLVSPDKSQTTRNMIVKTPVKIKMQKTLKKLDNEANNTPNKPNVLQIPKCTPKSLNNVTVLTKSNQILSHANTRQQNGNINNTKTLYNDDIKNHGKSSYVVSSSQAKVASTMGIMNFGAAYSSVVAAANRGCLNSKFSHQHPPPQPVIPKTFPVSAIAGGDLTSGGSNMIQPQMPGIVALTPQNIGLSFPFQKYYNVEHPHRRNTSTVMPDHRQLFYYSRVSGIYEWLNNQQEKIDFSKTLCCMSNKLDNDIICSSVSLENSSALITKTTDHISNKLPSKSVEKHENIDKYQSLLIEDAPAKPELCGCLTGSSNCPFSNVLSSQLSPKLNKILQQDFKSIKSIRAALQTTSVKPKSSSSLPLFKHLSIQRRNKQVC